jgi:hypothetical protein
MNLDQLTTALAGLTIWPEPVSPGTRSDSFCGTSPTTS